MHYSKYFIVIFFNFILSCSSNNIKSVSNNIENTEKPELLYVQAMEDFDKKNYEIAIDKLQKISKLYPLSNEAIQSQIMIGFSYYIQMDYEKAIFKFNQIIQKYPSHKNLDYVYYMRALCNYEQINNAQLDGAFNEVAINDFYQVINRFPLSEYAKDSYQKIILVKSNQAAKHMSIGKFYLEEKKYTAALNRYKIVVENFSETKFTPEALHRMVEIYSEIGMMQEAKKTASVLGYNYPKTKWYKYSYNLITNNKKDNSLIEKFKNFF